jgi:hypothetical protein
MHGEESLLQRHLHSRVYSSHNRCTFVIYQMIAASCRTVPLLELATVAFGWNVSSLQLAILAIVRNVPSLEVAIAAICRSVSPLHTSCWSERATLSGSYCSY